MTLQVVVVPHALVDPLKERAFCIGRGDMGERTSQEEWTEIAAHIVRSRPAAAEAFGFGTPLADVYLCLAGEAPAEVFSVGNWANLVANLRNRAWGSRVFWAVSDRIYFGSFSSQDFPRLEEWVAACVRRPCLSLVHLAPEDVRPQEIVDPATDGLASFRERYGTEAVHRVRTLFGTPPWSRKWGLFPLFDAERGNYRNFLGGLYVDGSGGESPAPDAVMLLADPSKKIHPEYAVKPLLAAGLGRQVAATATTVRPGGRCIKRPRGFPIPGLPVADFSGDCELKYLLHRVNFEVEQRGHLCGRCVPPTTVQTHHKWITETPVAANPRFLRAAGTSLTPGLLFTSSFDPDADEPGFEEAGVELGTIVESMPLETRHHVVPLLSLEDLVCLFAPAFEGAAVWIQSGHGEGKKGLLLHAAGGGPPTYLTPKGLIDIIPAGSRSFRLVVFSTCYSEAFAREFARNGAAAALGFRGPAVNSACKWFTAQLVLTALHTGGDVDAIRRSFVAHVGRYETLAAELLRSGGAAREVSQPCLFVAK